MRQRAGHDEHRPEDRAIVGVLLKYYRRAA
jgi:hypothetical protein